MSFAVPQDVVDLFRNLDTTVSNAAITDVKIQKWLDVECQFITGMIGTLYALPINSADSPLSFAILADIEACLVAAKVDDIINSYSDGDKKPYWRKNAMDRLREYVPEKDSKGNQPEPSVKLPDLQYVGTNVQKGRLSLASTATPIFSKGKDSW